MKRLRYDIVIVGSGAGGGTVAEQLSPLCHQGVRIAVLEKGPRLRDDEFTGRELEMAAALYEDGGGFLTSDGTMTLASGCAYGGSTVVYTGTSMLPPERVIQRWNVPGLTHADLECRARKYMAENNVHFLPDEAINGNNKLFASGCRALGYDVQQFPVNVKGCRGSSLCNLGCPNQAKQGTDRVQLPRAEQSGVEVVTRCEVLGIGERTLTARASPKPAGGKGDPSPWEPGDYQIDASIIVLCAGALHTPALLRHLPLPRIGRGFTCHPAMIMVAEHNRPITNFIGHPKSYYLDQFAESEHFVLETCMYFPFITAKSLAGFGAPHSAFMQAFPRLQMILVLACDKADAHNRVTFDRAGRPVADYRFQPGAIHGLIRGAITSARIFFAAGAARVHMPVARSTTIDARDAARLDEIAASAEFTPGKTPVSAAHLQGGCAMGAGPSDSVTDCWGRVHGHPRLFVADASLFPDSLEINPYVTIMALADRVAQRIREEVPALL
ncbi:MAG TPA: GMC family oxidoreductase [Bryobacteraceae bacterium]|nr:GMC family oxidoreductase [Bryobacteraceae bacterium]